MRKILSVIVAKCLILLGKLLGKKGSSTPGSIALKIYPDILKDLAKQVKEKTVLVCGTNGKTTTTNLLYSLIANCNKKVVCNNVGANMLPGVACAYIAKANIFGKLNADYAVLECDEAYLRHIVKHVNADKIIITNLFRDQLDRYGEIDATVKLLDEAFSYAENFELILNGDDPLCAHFAGKYNAKSYGISEDKNLCKNEIKEGRFCLNCQNELTYNYCHYSQLGDFKCEKCGYKRNKPDYDVTNINLDGAMKFDVSFLGKKVTLNVNYKGFYNIYNILAAFSAYNELGLDISGINNVFNSYKPQIGRMETFTINKKDVTLNLSKNGAGFNQAIATLLNDTREKDVYFVLNDAPSDGTDITWLWDVDFELLKSANIKNIYSGGTRKDDLAIRISYAGFENVCVMDNNKENLRKFLFSSNSPAYLLVNYTALFQTQNDLKTLEKE